ncbi:hypothetical protein D3C72_957000 [compost metagenome]
MLRVFEDRAARADFHDLPQVHHRHPMTHPFHHRHIVRNEQERHSQFPLQIQQQIHDLRLDRHIQRRHRLIRNHHLRIQRQRPRNADTLALPARKLMRIAVDHFRHQPALFHQPAHPFLGRLALGHPVDQQGFHDRITHRHARVQRCKRVLENELDMLPQRLHRATAQRADVLAVELDRAALALHQLQQRPTRCRLAAARLTHQR